MSSRPKSFFERTRHPYYIASPAFRQSSGGVRALHYFCHALNESGHEAYIATEPGGTSPHLRTPELTQEVIKRHKAAGCVPIGVYPEVAHGNVLGLSVVARWILNKPGHLGGEKVYAKDEILFYWDAWMLNPGIVAEKLNIPIIDRRIFNDRLPLSERKGFCYYANKYFRFEKKLSPALVENGTSLCQHIPRSPQEIAEILRTSEVFYCYEPSSLVLEAMACGCPVAMVDTPYLDEFNWDQNPIFRIKESDIGKIKPPAIDAARAKKVDDYFTNLEIQAWRQIDNFIEKTQAAARDQLEYQKTPEYLLGEAIKAFHNGEIEPAMIGLAPLLDSLPDNPLPPAYLAFICAARRLPQAAQEFMDKVMKLAPERADLKAALGEAFLKADQPLRAAEHLREAIQLQPDMLWAYPDLAEALYQNGEPQEAIWMLKAAFASSRSPEIQSRLVEMAIRHGEPEEIIQVCRRARQTPAYHSLLIRMLGLTGCGAEEIQTEQAAFRQHFAPSPSSRFRHHFQPGRPLTIAFLISDFGQFFSANHLEILLQRLPACDFRTILINNDPDCSNNELAQRSSLLCDIYLPACNREDSAIVEVLDQLDTDILIDLDGHGGAQRAGLMFSSRTPLKIVWSNIPPLLDDKILSIQALALATSQTDAAIAGTIQLSGIGEYLPMPDIDCQPPPCNGPHYGCLTPAIRLTRDSWDTFSALLRDNCDASLTINLGMLDGVAKQRIINEFAATGVSAQQLRFIKANSLEVLCQAWNEINVGLAPLHGDGDLALPACLWMNRPYVALDSHLPWSGRPAALLRLSGHAHCIASSRAEYLNIAHRLGAIQEIATSRQALQASGAYCAESFVADFAEQLKLAYYGS